MDFNTATDQLMARGVSLEEIGAALDVAYTTARAYRLDPGSTSHRRPPDDWRARLQKLARSRGEELLELAEEMGVTALDVRNARGL